MKQILFIISILALFIMPSCKQDVVPATHQRYDPITEQSVDAMSYLFHNGSTFTGVLDQSKVDITGSFIYMDPSNTISYEIDGADGTRSRNVESIRHSVSTDYAYASWLIIKYDGSLVAIPCLLKSNTTDDEIFRIITIYQTANSSVGNYVAVPVSEDQNETGSRLTP